MPDVMTLGWGGGSEILGRRSIVRLPSGQELSMGRWRCSGSERVTCSNHSVTAHCQCLDLIFPREEQPNVGIIQSVSGYNTVTHTQLAEQNQIIIH